MDANITQAIGLSDDDTSDLLRKYYGFFHTLNPAQQDVVRKCMPSFDEAAAAIGQGTSAADIQKFVASRLGGGAAQGIPVPATSSAAQGVPVPATSSAAQGVPVPTAQSAAGIPVPINKSK
jgi:hypothetical protein